MCGLVGVAGKISKEGRRAFKRMLQLDTARGPHSTGVATIGPNGVAVDKALGTPWDFYPLFKERFANGVPDAGCNVLIGHNRWATMGAITADNAHPFTEGDITGAHNGTLEQSAFRRIDKDNEFETDSNAIFYNIDKYGLRETYSNLSGAWALTFFDDNTKRMNFIRNDQRPLFMVRSEDDTMLFWASEAWMINRACLENNIKIKKIFQIHTNTLYYAEWDEAEGVVFKKEGEKYEPHAPEPTLSYYGGRYSENFPSGNISTSTSTNFGVETKTPKVSRKVGEAVQKAFQEKQGRYVAFYTYPSDVGSNIGGYTIQDTTNVIIPNHMIDPDMKSEVERYFGENWDNWHLGKVKYVSASGDQVNLVVDPDTISEPLDWAEYAAIHGVDTFSEDDYLRFNVDELVDYIRDVGIDVLSPPLGNDIEYLIRNETLSRDEVAKYLAAGCGWCTTVEGLDKLDKCIHLGEKQYLCSDCSTRPDITESCNVTALVH